MLAALLVTAIPIRAQAPAVDAMPVLKALRGELERSIATFAKQPTPVYYLSYEVTETRRVGLQASFGTVTGRSDGESRLVDIDLRVGSYELDNSHPIRSGQFFMPRMPSFVQAPVGDVDALRRTLWYHTDKEYKQATEQLTRVMTDVQVKVVEEDQAGDFSPAPAAQWVEDPVELTVDRDRWEDRLRAYSAPFSTADRIYQARATLSAIAETRWFVNSEGSSIRTGQTYYRLSIHALTKADDGMELPRYESFFAFTPDGLPDDRTVLQAVDAMIRDLEALREAPVVDPYTGPAILSGRASGVFFHELLGHRVEGHRQKYEHEGQTFREMVDQQVLPETISVVFDPTVRQAESRDLVGAYRYDNQGVEARRVPVIEAGVLRNFLMSRTPIEGFARSNGHGRKQAGMVAVARQSNLFVEVANPHTRAELKAMLIDRLRQENKPFGLYFADIQGGFTTTGRFMPNAFNVRPIMVYRIHVDGREELVRGVDLIGTPLTTISRVIAADDQREIFNGFCGAESGSVPVGTVAPGILVAQIEVQKKEKSQERPPILPRPRAAT